MSDTFAEWQAEATADEAVRYVCLNRRLYRDYIDVCAQVERLKDGQGQAKLDGPDDDELSGLLARVAELEDALSAAEKPMVFRALSPARRRQLVEQHPPSEQQKQEDARVEVNPDAYWPAVLAECCVDPGLTADQARWLRDGDGDWPGLPDDKWNELVSAVTQANVSGSSIPKGVRSTVRRLRPELNSITQPDTESR